MKTYLKAILTFLIALILSGGFVFCIIKLINYGIELKEIIKL